ncbi:MAG: tetratricopeptide repeat-containing sulfotransferase family protein [Halorhodospira sp.]
MEALWQAGRRSEARQEAERRLRSNHQDGLAWKLLGLCRWEDGEADEALTALEYAEQVWPQDAEIPRALGRILAGRGQGEAAVRAYQRALDRAPTWGEALEELVRLGGRVGRREVSTTYLDAALTRVPDNTSLLYSAGVVYKEMGEYETAIARFQRILEIEPKHVLALNELGLCEYSRNNLQVAETYLRQANEADSQNATPYYNRAIVHLENQAYSEARDAFARAVVCNPTHLDAQFGLVRAYERLNDLEGAESALASAEEANGEHAKFHAAAARVALRRNDMAEAERRLNRIDWDALGTTTYQETLFLAGEIRGRLKDVDGAVAAYTEANEAQRETPRARGYDKRAFLQEIERGPSVFTAQAVASWPAPTRMRVQQDPVFFVGFPRSGTTLLETVLDAHPEVSVMEEKPVVGNVMDKIRALSPGYPDAISRLGPRDIRTLREFYYQERERFLSSEDHESELIVDKLPLNSAHIGALHRIFPGAKFIFAQRHPADAVLSCFMQHFRPNAAMNNFYSIEEATYCYDVVMTLVKQYHELLPLNIAYVPYEAMIADLEGTVRPVLDFIGVGWHDKVREYRDHAANSGRINTPSYRQVSEPLYTRARYRWQQYRDHMARELETLIPWAEWHGYRHHEDGTITAPGLSIHQPEPVPEDDPRAQEPQPAQVATTATSHQGVPGAGAVTADELGAQPMLIEGFRKVTLRNGLVRIECIQYAPGGEPVPAGVLHVPASQAEMVAAKLRRTLQQLQKQAQAKASEVA